MLAKYKDLIEHSDITITPGSKYCGSVHIGNDPRYWGGSWKGIYVGYHCSYCKQTINIDQYCTGLNIHGQICDNCVQTTVRAVRYRKIAEPAWFTIKYKNSDEDCGVECLTFHQYVFTNARFLVAVITPVQHKMMRAVFVRYVGQDVARYALITYMRFAGVFD